MVLSLANLKNLSNWWGTLTAFLRLHFVKDPSCLKCEQSWRDIDSNGSHRLSKSLMDVCFFTYPAKPSYHSNSFPFFIFDMAHADKLWHVLKKLRGRRQGYEPGKGENWRVSRRSGRFSYQTRHIWVMSHFKVWSSRGLQSSPLSPPILKHSSHKFLSLTRNPIF